MKHINKTAIGALFTLVASNANAIPFNLDNTPSGFFPSYTSGDITVSNDINNLSVRNDGIYNSTNSDSVFSSAEGTTFGVNSITITEIDALFDDYLNTSMWFSADTQSGQTYNSEQFNITNDINLIDSLTINGNDLFAGITDFDITDLYFWRGDNDLHASVNLDYTSYDINTGNNGNGGNATPVPETPTLPLIAAGLGLLALSRKKMAP